MAVMVMIFGASVAAGQSSTDEENGRSVLRVAPVALLWTREPGQRFQIESATVGAFERVEGIRRAC
jgi:hypothetical protein